MVLDLAGLDVAKVTVDGQPPAKYAARSNRLVLTLPRAGQPRHVVPRGA